MIAGTNAGGFMLLAFLCGLALIVCAANMKAKVFDRLWVRVIVGGLLFIGCGVFVMLALAALVLERQGTTLP